MSEIYRKKVIIALGHFDSVHLGHRTVIKLAVDTAKATGVIPAVFMFYGDLKGSIKKSNTRPVYSVEKRMDLIKNLGVNEFYLAPVNQEFLSYSKSEFLDLLNEKYDILGYVSGSDYRFGKNATGDVDFLREYAKGKNQKVLTANDQTVDGKRLSTTLIKEYLIGGGVKTANALLGENYSITGSVIKGRKVGRNLGFPTVNVAIDNETLSLKSGVYKGLTTIDDKTYKAIINYGARPTYSLYEKLIEAHIIDYNGDLYGKEITLEFTDYLRDVIAFNSELDLKNQLTYDMQRVKNDD